MSDKEHVRILKQGRGVWYRWRRKNPDILPDLSRARLDGADLSMADLSRANLSKASFLGSNLKGAKLCQANLWEANFFGANLSEADLHEAILIMANLNGSRLVRANLRRADLTETSLEVETAFDKETADHTVLFPVRLDDTVMRTDRAWAADIRRTRHIGDFRQ